MQKFFHFYEIFVKFVLQILKFKQKFIQNKHQKKEKFINFSNKNLYKRDKQNLL